ncbi:hypothetical protein ACFSKI_19100 [Pseudogracilibacillus auburnensis]
MMKFDLLKNGCDSFKIAHELINQYRIGEEIHDYHLKDIVIYMNHGIEILMKYILSNKDEVLLFNNIDRYAKARKEMKDKGHTSVFKADSKLHTINLNSAIERIEHILDIKIEQELKKHIDELIIVRNELMHYTTELTTREALNLVDDLEICYELSYEFFATNIGRDVFESSLEFARRKSSRFNDYLVYRQEESDKAADAAIDSYEADRHEQY